MHIAEANTSIPVPLTNMLIATHRGTQDEANEQQEVAEPIRQVSAGDVPFDALTHLDQRPGDVLNGTDTSPSLTNDVFSAPIPKATNITGGKSS